ncbi:MAG: N-acetyl-gamma-glutamyl-phosphate reductase [Eubacteriales bacterium]|nr:N-acetyl-gamma-glutamyl-phosphate reductase [Eubacteriales bacterium]
MKVFIDGSYGTTGLRIHERLKNRSDIELIQIPYENRHDHSARLDAYKAAEIVFTCLPDDAAREAAAMADSCDVRLIDASTAHRTASGWTYGFPEITGADTIRNSNRIANPGCHASGVNALLSPLVQKGILPRDTLLSCFSITGYSGGGKKMIGQYEESGRDSLLDAPRMYGLSQKHKHLPEIVAVSSLASEPVFCPIVSDYYSGMETIIPLFHSQIKGSAEDIRETYQNFYTGPLVKYTPNADENGFTSAGSMSGRDDMEISVYGNADRILLVARFDNLGKGASGSAIQNLNLMMGIDETTGLNLGGVSLED